MTKVHPSKLVDPGAPFRTKAYHVDLEWDGEAKVWVASSEDVPGLATGADTMEELIDRLKSVIPDLLEANGMLPEGATEVPFSIRAERVEHPQRAA